LLFKHFLRQGFGPFCQDAGKQRVDLLRKKGMAKEQRFNLGVWIRALRETEQMASPYRIKRNLRPTSLRGLDFDRKPYTTPQQFLANLHEDTPLFS